MMHQQQLSWSGLHVI